jgi:damage-control phosphatase, subfamily III
MLRFVEFWGNAPDLSLLTTLKFEDLERLHGEKATEAQQQNIVLNDMNKSLEIVESLKGAQTLSSTTLVRIFIFMLIIGFELFVDVFLAAYFLEIGVARTIVYHPKDFGWFVSDVLPADFDSLFDLLSRDAITDTPQHKEDLLFLRHRWLNKSGQIKTRTDPFWTTPYSYWRMPTFAPELNKVLQESDLVIYKGDLNYRKLVADVVLA